MKTNTNDTWLRLVSTARLARDDRPSEAPFGFSTRVSALAMSLPRQSFVALFDRLSHRALGIAAILFVACAALNMSSTTATSEDELIVQDPVVEMIEVAS